MMGHKVNRCYAGGLLRPRPAPPCIVLLGFCAALFFGPLATFPAAAQQSDLQTLLDRLDRVQRELNTLQRQVYQGGRPPPAPARPPASSAAPSPLAARLQVKLDEIEVQIRGLTGKFEELNHNNNQLRARIDKLSSDAEIRFSAIEERAAAAEKKAAAAPAAAGAGTPGTGVVGGVPGRARSQALPGGEPPGALGTIFVGGAQGSGSTVLVKAQPAASVLPAGPPEEQYRFAYKLLIQTDYVDAENAFRAFVTAHPDHKLAGNAHYWLGETYYVRNDFNSAARTFAEGYRKFPKSAKGPDNLLKLGLSLARLGSKQDACATFARLSKEFPKAPANIIVRAKAERKNNDCK